MNECFAFVQHFASFWYVECCVCYCHFYLFDCSFGYCRSRVLTHVAQHNYNIRYLYWKKLLDGRFALLSDLITKRNDGEI
jgi:hypothetical protein